MTNSKTISSLQSKGWNVVTEGNDNYVYRHGTKATVVSFESVEAAWEWLQEFLKTV